MRRLLMVALVTVVVTYTEGQTSGGWRLRCLDCFRGLLPTDGGSTCGYCPENCDECSSDGLCEICQPRYRLDNNGTCQACPSSCDECVESNNCTKCQDFYSWDHITGACIPCGSSRACLTCDVDDVLTSGACTSCSLGYGLQNGECTVCPNRCEQCVEDQTDPRLMNCTTCLSQYILRDEDVPGRTQCLSCPDECTECVGTENVYMNHEAVCVSCEPGYGNFRNVCRACSDNCVVCHYDWDSDVMVCDECDSGYGVLRGSCAECPMHVESCEFDENWMTINKQCDAGFGQIEQPFCQDCQEPNCQSCPYDSCEQCDIGFAIQCQSEETCRACPTYCVRCAQLQPSGYTLCVECLPYFVLDTGSCYGCPENCLEDCHYNTEERRTQCTSCRYGYTSNNKGECLDCSDYGCAACVLSDDIPNPVCTSCPSGYVLIESSGTCTACLEGCLDCRYVNVVECRSCQPGYAFNNVTRTCQECASFLTGCDECELTDAIRGLWSCTACQLGHYYIPPTDGASSDCVLCPEAFCRHCSYDDVTKAPRCTTCGNFYELDDDYQCQACPSNCRQCSWVTVDGTDTLTCDECVPGFVLNTRTDQCLVCLDSCESCEYDFDTDSTKCTTCRPYYTVTGLTCTVCPNMCMECEDTTSGVQCTSCLTAHALNITDGTCHACPQWCDVCEIDSDLDSVVCSSCLPNYGLASDDSCAPCEDVCVSCNYGHCQACQTGYLLDCQPECKACSDHCESCHTRESWCDVCASGYVLDTQGTCQACWPHCSDGCVYDAITNNVSCTACDDYYFLNTTTDACHACPSRCTKCEDSAGVICTECDPGYSASSDGSGCFVCPRMCQTCYVSNDDVTVCGECMEYAYLKDNTTCEVCPAYCEECQLSAASDIQCLRCVDGYVVNDAGGCSVCPGGCSVCHAEDHEDGGDLVCEEDSCSPGRIFVETTASCVYCGPSCESCHYDLTTDTVWCDTCRHGYYSSSGQCQGCPRMCGRCSAGSSGDLVCQECTAGYGLDWDGICQTCRDGCTECASDEDTELYCTTCRARTFLTHTSLQGCTACPAYCEECHEGDDVMICDRCISGYTRSDSACVLCGELLEFCLDCTDMSDEGGAKCTACQPRYALNPADDTCTSCPSGCDSCKYESQSSCETCAANYTCTEDGGQCEKACYTCEDGSDWSEHCEADPDNLGVCGDNPGVCWLGVRRNVNETKHYKGCHNELDNVTQCTPQFRQKVCQFDTVKKEMVCTQCCEGAVCNNFTLRALDFDLTSSGCEQRWTLAHLITVIMLMWGVLYADY